MLQETCKDHDIDTDLDQYVQKLSRIFVLDVLGKPLEQVEAPLIHHDEELECLVTSPHRKIKNNEGNSCKDFDHRVRGE